MTEGREVWAFFVHWACTLVLLLGAARIVWAINERLIRDRDHSTALDDAMKRLGWLVASLVLVEYGLWL